MHVTRFCSQTKATHLFASLSQVIPGKQKRVGSEPPLGHVGASCAMAVDEQKTIINSSNFFFIILSPAGLTSVLVAFDS